MLPKGTFGRLGPSVESEPGARLRPYPQSIVLLLIGHLTFCGEDCAEDSIQNRLKAGVSVWLQSSDCTDWFLLGGLEQGIVPVQKDKLEMCLHTHS